MTQKPAVQTESHEFQGLQVYFIMCVRNLKGKPVVYPRKQFLRSGYVALRSRHHPLRSVVLSGGFELCFLT